MNRLEITSMFDKFRTIDFSKKKDFYLELVQKYLLIVTFSLRILHGVLQKRSQDCTLHDRTPVHIHISSPASLDILIADGTEMPTD